MRNKQAAAGLVKSAPTVKDPLGYLQQANVAVEFLVKQASSRQSAWANITQCVATKYSLLLINIMACAQRCSVFFTMNTYDNRFVCRAPM